MEMATPLMLNLYIQPHKTMVILDDNEIKKLYDFYDSIAKSENHFYKHAPSSEHLNFAHYRQKH